ncbi:hypothetical protein V8D89_008378 [Ganoderma adspersum]
MASCGICARKTCDEPMPRDSGFHYCQGDVYGLRESVYTPIYDILVHTFSQLGGESDALKRSQRSFDEFTSVPNGIRGGRPAVIMKDDDDNRPGLMVCVATTYDGEDISKLPRIFQHFSIRIASHDNVPPEDHVHALPGWDRQNAYIIAWPFQSTATLESVWTTQANDETKKVRQVLGRDAMEFLVTECTKRKEKWEKMCEDPRVALELEAELRQHVEERKKPKRVYSGTGSRASSLDSLAPGSGVDSPCWRSTMCGATIPEEPEDNVHPGTTGHASEPWKVVSKHRPGSTYSVNSAFGKKKSHTDNRSLKSKRSFVHQPHNGSGIFNFDILRAVRVK